MAESVYTVIELVGTSQESWEPARRLSWCRKYACLLTARKENQCLTPGEQEPQQFQSQLASLSKQTHFI